MDERELVVLQEFGRNPTTSQRALATRLGVALGLANAIVKRIARRGLIKIQRFKPNRLGYYLTPKGLHARGRLMLTRIRETIDFYRLARVKAVTGCRELKSKGIRRAALYRTGELAEIIFLAMREAGIEVAYVIDKRPTGKRWLGIPLCTETAIPLPAAVDVVVCTSSAKNGVRANIQRRLKVPFVDASKWFEN